MKNNPLICAIDSFDLDYSYKLASILKGKVACIKLGLELSTSCGVYGVQKISELGIPIFLDLKLHDIPNTVRKTAAVLKSLNLFMLTIHISGGANMLQAVTEELPDVQVIGVTLLTSLSNQDLQKMNIVATTQAQVIHLAKIAQSCGLSGVVCAGEEIAQVRKECGKNFTLVSPGIRPIFSNEDDHKRIMSPSEAIKQGADYIVIGRPITASKDPVSVVEKILAES